MTARIDKYIYYLEKYNIYSTLLVLDEYEKEERYEECAIIRDALKKYKKRFDNKFPKGVSFPTSMDMYRSRENLDLMKRLNISIDYKSAKDKAKLIKINLPIKNGL